MSLIDAFMTDCVYMNKSKVADGEGGTVTTWTEGAHFDAAIVLQGSSVAMVAEAIKEKKNYIVTFAKGTSIEYGDVIKRMSDGVTFKITSDAIDQETPASSTLNISQTTAERWDLTT